MLTSRLMWVVTGALSWIQKQIYAHSLILKGQTLQTLLNSPEVSPLR